MMPRVMLVVILALCASCGSSDFNEDKVRAIMAAQPMNLDGEQVALTPKQLECGVQEELWEAPAPVSQERASARLTAKGRNLKFSDDVSVGEVGFRQPYLQVRGSFPVQANEVLSIKDGPNDTKLVETRLGVTIGHSCFANPASLMGVRNGKFRQDIAPVLSFRRENEGWRFDKLVH